MKIYILTIGDELLIGQVIDSNSAWMAQQLNLIGARVVGKATVSDDHEDILAGMAAGLEKADALLITGGLGPTKDDVTKKAIADFYGVGFIFSQETYEHISDLFARYGRPLNETVQHQCLMPQNALLLRNKMGTAPGMWFDENDKVVVSMPGVPYEMQYLMEKEVLPRLSDRFPAQPIAHRTLLTAGVGESVLADLIAGFEDFLPPHIKLAYLPSIGQVRLRLTGQGPDREALDRELDERAGQLRSLLGDHCFGAGSNTLENTVGELLRSKNLLLGTAESCTGGFLAHRITSVPGSSDYFAGSVIAYSNAIKEKMLAVSSDTLLQHGAVSEETVIDMVKGALDQLDCHLAVSTSGIAGPGGGTPEKPVGTIWIAIGNREKIETFRLNLGKDRLKNIEYTSVFALNKIRLFVQRHC